MKISTTNITRTTGGRIIDHSAPRNTRNTSEWLDSIRRPPRTKRPSEFGTPNEVQKVKKW